MQKNEKNLHFSLDLLGKIEYKAPVNNNKTTTTMKTIFTLNGKKISKQEAQKLVGGKQELVEKIEEAKEIFFDEPETAIEWFVGVGRLGIEFC